MSEYDFTPIIAVLILVGAVLFSLRQAKVFHQTPCSGGNGTRPDQRIPVDERRLLGPDYRVHTDDYAQRRWESRVRTRSAVNRVCGIHPSTPINNGAEVLTHPAPQAKEFDSVASTEQ